MLLKRLIVASLAACALATSSASIALAGGTYPIPPNGIEVDDSTVVAGQTVTLTAQCFMPGTTAQFTVEDANIGSAIADADGVVTLLYAVPEGTGDIIVQASGTGCDGLPLVLGITLTREVGSAALPRTGSDSSLPMARLAASLVAAGALMVFASRWRQQRSAPASS